MRLAGALVVVAAGAALVAGAAQPAPLPPQVDQPSQADAAPHPFTPLDDRPGAVLSWPVSGAPEVLRPFTWQPPDWQPGHRGVDLAAQAGTPVLAPADGVVAFAGTVVNRGVLTVQHGQLRSSFEPVDPALPAGTAVRRGQVVAHVSAAPTHCANRTCLHWGVRRGNDYLDPQALAGKRHVAVLLE